MAGRRVKHPGQLCPEPVGDTEPEFDNQIRKVMDDMSWPAPRNPSTSS
jgi:hypothetical protein